MEEIIKLIKDNKIISKDGIKVAGNGIIIKKLDELIKLQDMTNKKIYFLEKRLEEIRDKNI